MNTSRKKRLEKVAKRVTGKERRYKSAKVVCDPEIMNSFDSSMIDADFVLILPDNGRRGDGQTVPKGSYLVDYF
ncbi:unknown protein [Waddlia chondrophila 2032/99]|uniref:Uncharacterized protein n=1 Tax=Waddlia chondrophila 2032/99 TaxID=765953 RepID=F8LCB2_9BACT|nr:unknown protein [Waddlia chondrophila 2032/99]